MLDVSSILSDPELGGAVFTVTRKTYRRELGEVVLSESEGFTASGAVQPASSEDLALFPQEERSEDMIVILSPFHFSLGAADPSGLTFTSADTVRWQGRVYRVVRVKDWLSQGGYRKAWAVRQKEPPSGS